MCGLLTVYRKNDQRAVERPLFARMLDMLSLRGPDEKTIHEEGPVFLGHTRLCVIDLTTGSQPLFNEDRTVACVFNGEIYNYVALRENLRKKGHTFTTSSDTEVLVHLYEEEGENLFKSLDGMFSVVIYDKKSGRMIVGRDRMGEKPLYYVNQPEFFACASELKALLACPSVSRELNVDALAAYLSSMYVPAPLSIFKSIRKLKPGSLLIFDGKNLQEKVYWAPQVKVQDRADRAQVLEEIRQRLSRSVKNRLKADVPLGVFLSGGIDSSSVVAFMAQHSSRPVETYAVGFGNAINELPYANEVAQRYGTNHTEIVISGDVMEALPKIVSIYDEPFADTSSIPTYLISREARKHVTVVLTGDGGDELFAGYDLYNDQKFYSGSRLKSRGVRSLEAWAGAMGNSVLDSWYPLTTGNGSREYWRNHRSIFSEEAISRLLKRSASPIPALFAKNGSGLKIQDRDPLSEAFSFDLDYYLPDDLLKKVDIASMAHGLECRAPFLDHALVEYSMSIPPLWKLKGRQTKTLLREAMRELLPASIIDREKQGFGIPINQWIRGPLKPSIEETVLNGAFLQAVMDSRQVKILLTQAMDPGCSDWRIPFQLWSLFMLELWAREYQPAY